jgi:hypothetical protein
MFMLPRDLAGADSAVHNKHVVDAIASRRRVLAEAPRIRLSLWLCVSLCRARLCADTEPSSARQMAFKQL